MYKTNKLQVLKIRRIKKRIILQRENEKWISGLLYKSTEGL